MLPIWAMTSLAIAALVAAIVWKANLSSSATAPSAIGGPFNLTTQSGTQVDERILKGKWTVVYFGYTACPDVCPTTLTNLALAIDALGPKARDLQVVFISVDPERDTPERLRAYVSSAAFPKGMIGLTGTAEQLAATAKAYRVYLQEGRGAGCELWRRSYLGSLSDGSPGTVFPSVELRRPANRGRRPDIPGDGRGLTLPGRRVIPPRRAGSERFPALAWSRIAHIVEALCTGKVHLVSWT